jgi:hypothetical protein
MGMCRAVTRRLRAAALAACAAAPAGGCLSAPPADNPLLIRYNADGFENPILVSPGQPTPASYREVFEKCVDVLDDYFDLLPPNAYDGRIVTKPRIAPGYEQFWKAGNPDPRQRLLATLQSVRQTAMIEIHPGDRGGYLVYVVVEKELEDLPRPTRSLIGNAVFQEPQTVDRTVEVISPGAIVERGWFKVGRDYAFEQELLSRIRACK